METRRLGRTGHHSSVAILGGAAFARATPDETATAFAAALDRGVNHLDIAPRYGDAELVAGPLVPPVRDRLFVACKTTRRAPDGVRAQLDESRRRLGVEQFDLYQAHAVTEVSVLDERTDALEAILAARDAGITRFAGITGHGLDAPATFIEALRRYDLDTVMFPVYPRLWADDAYRAAAEELLALCAARDVGVMAIKAAAHRPWGDGARHATTWYDPAPDTAALAQGIGFALSTPGVHAVCTPGDLTMLARALDVAARATPMAAAEHDAAVAAMRDLPLIFPMPV